MSKRRASMREGPLADLFRQTDGSQENVAETPAESAAAAAAAAAGARAESRARARAEPAARARRGRSPTRRSAPSPSPPSREPDVPEDEPAEPPRLRAVPDPTDAPEMPALPEALRARGEASAYLASIRVVGVGGGGLNALQRMIDADIHGVEFVAINTDAQQLAMSDADREAADRPRAHERARLRIRPRSRPQGRRGLDRPPAPGAARSDLVFVTAGEGGGTGTGAAPVIARVARELGALTVGIVTMPFGFEGSRRTEAAQAGLDALQGGVDTLIVVPNDRLLEVLERGVSMVDAFRMADDVLRQGVQGICDLITRPGVINLDFADVRTVMAESGSALMGIGMATGPARGREAARRALDSPLIGQRIRGATGVLLSIMGPPELTLQEVTEAAEAVREAAAGQANIIFGTSVDESLGDQLWVTVIATGFERQREHAAQRARALARPLASAGARARRRPRRPVLPARLAQVLSSGAGCDRRRASGDGGRRSRGAARGRLGRRRLRGRGLRLLDRRAGADGPGRRRLPRRLRRCAPPPARDRLLRGRARRGLRRGAVAPLEPYVVDFGTGQQIFLVGPGSCAVPGVTAGLEDAHRRLGRLPWAELTRPAVALAHAGVELTPAHADVIDLLKGFLGASPEGARVFGPPDAPLRGGDHTRNPPLGDTLERIAAHGARELADGETARAIVAHQAATGGR